MVAILLPVFCFAQNSASDKDELLNILQEQVKLQSAKYSQFNIPVYRLSMTVEESSKQGLSVSSGSPYLDEEPMTTRNLTVYMVLGTEEFHYSGLCHEFAVLPLCNDKSIIERQIDQLVQRSYQCALSLYLKLEDSTEFDEGSLSDYEFPKDTFHYESPETGNYYNHDSVLEKLENVTEYGSRQQDVSECAVSMNYERKRTYYVSNENAIVVDNQITTNAFLTLCTGKRCLHQNYYVEHPDDLPDVETMLTDVSVMYDSLAGFSDIPALYPKLAMPAPIEEGFGASEYSVVAFQAMQDEMEANLSELRFSGQYPPYAIRYVIADAQPYQVTSSFGCTTKAVRECKRVVAAEVNVGNDIFNDTHYSPRETMAMAHAPLDNSYTSLREAIRYATFNQYMHSVEHFKGKCRYLKREHLEMGSQLPDRLEADKVDQSKYALAAPMSMDPVDIHAMQNLSDELSALFNKCKDADKLSTSFVDIQGCQGNYYLLASDGTRLIQPFSYVTIELFGEWNQKSCSASRVGTFTSFDQFPDISELKQWVYDFLDYLVELRDAPDVSEIYDGPVLFEGNAAASLFAQAVVGLSAERQPIDDNGYVTFSRDLQIDERIFSPIVDITAVDTTSSFDGVQFIGTYTVDADGVAPIPDLELVRRGELITLLSNREPTQAKLLSNGHHRIMANLSSDEYRLVKLELGCAPGVTRLTSHRRLSKEKLEKQLLKLARTDGYRYAYIVSECYPNQMAVYRIDVNTGKRQLVKSQAVSSFEGFFCLRDLEATSDHYIGYNSVVNARGPVPTSVIVPDGLLFRHYRIAPAWMPMF